MLAKIWTIAWKDQYLTFTDRNLLLIMIVTPLVLSAIIGSAFSGFLQSSGRDVPVRNIPIVIVNQDQGVTTGDQAINHGQTIVDLFVPPADMTEEQVNAENNALYDLTDAVAMDDPEAAQAAVRAGEATAAVIIPPEFSDHLTYRQDRQTLEPVTIEIYINESAPISANIIRSVITSISNQFVTGSITVAATMNALVEQAQADPSFGLQFLAASSSFNPDFSPAFDTSIVPIRIDQQTVTGEVAAFNPLAIFGSAQAIFFMTFTALGGALSVLEEKRDGTLDRLIVSPTPRIAILLGKLVGTFISCVFQVALLIIGLTLVGSLIAGELQFIWGNSIGLLILTILAVAFAASGLGALIASLMGNPEQGSIVTSIISLTFGVLGGAFFNVQTLPGLRELSRFTPNYWGVDAFTRLSLNQTDIGLNLLVLFAIGAVLFLIGGINFNRRMEV